MKKFKKTFKKGFRKSFKKSYGKRGYRKLKKYYTVQRGGTRFE